MSSVEDIYKAAKVVEAAARVIEDKEEFIIAPLAPAPAKIALFQILKLRDFI